MKKIKFKYLILFVDIVVIALIVLIKFNVFSSKTNVDEDIVTDDNIIVFKSFTFDLPEDIYITNIGDYTFTIDRKDKWEATIEIFKNNENGIFKYPDRWKQQTLSYGDDVNDYEYLSIGDKNVLIYRRPDELSLLCYLEDDFPVAYEIDLFSLTENIDDNLEEVVDIIINNNNYASSEDLYHNVKILDEEIVIDEETME